MSTPAEYYNGRRISNVKQRIRKSLGSNSGNKEYLIFLSYITFNGYGKYAAAPANLKYYCTDFVSRDEEFLADELLKHITEMIQLEHGVNIDDKQYVMVLSDEEADELQRHWNEYQDIKAIYISRKVLLTTEQNMLFRNTEIHIIPDDYFEFELKEEGQAW